MCTGQRVIPNAITTFGLDRICVTLVGQATIQFGSVHPGASSGHYSVVFKDVLYALQALPVCVHKQVCSAVHCFSRSGLAVAWLDCDNKRDVTAGYLAMCLQLILEMQLNCHCNSCHFGKLTLRSSINHQWRHSRSRSGLQPNSQLLPCGRHHTHMHKASLPFASWQINHSVNTTVYLC